MHPFRKYQTEENKVIDKYLEKFTEVMERTNSKTVEDVLIRFSEAQTLQTHLQNQSSLAEGKVVLLRAELATLTSYYVEVSLSSSDAQGSGVGGAGNESAAVSELADNRALDERLIQSQLTLNQIVRQTEKSESHLNEVLYAAYSVSSHYSFLHTFTSEPIRFGVVFPI